MARLERWFAWLVFAVATGVLIEVAVDVSR